MFKEEKVDFENEYLGALSKYNHDSRGDYQKRFLFLNKTKISRQNYGFQREKICFFSSFASNGLVYMNIAEVADYQFAEKYLAKGFMRKVYKTEKFKVNGIQFGEELIISTIKPKPVG